MAGAKPASSCPLPLLHKVSTMARAGQGFFSTSITKHWESYRESAHTKYVDKAEMDSEYLVATNKRAAPFDLWAAYLK